MEKLLTTHQLAKLLNVWPETLRRWEREGKLIPLRTPGGHRRYKESQVLALIGKEITEKGANRCAVYARVSTAKQAEAGNLQRQKERLIAYAVEKGYQIKAVYTEIASGLNENRRELAKLAKTATKGEIEVIVIENKERLARFGYKYLEQYCRSCGVEIDIVELGEEKSPQEELVEDMIAIVTNRISVLIYLAHKPSQKTGLINGRNYRQMVLDYLKTGGAYQVEIIRENSRYYIHVTIEEEIPVPYIPHSGVIGVDTNPDGLGIARADCLGQFKESLWLPQGEWTYARSTRRDNLIGEAAALVVDMAKQLNCALAVEDLKFKNDKSVTAKFNRMSHSFVWSRFLQALERRAAREGVPLAKVPPPFTSIIGILKYQQQYGISNHEAAAYTIARRGLGYGKEKVPKQLIQRFIKERDAFMFLANWKQWSSIKKAAVAAVKKLTKRKVKSLVSWQHYRKQLLAG